MEVIKKKRVVTKHEARRQFSAIGLTLIAYGLFVLYIPQLLEILLTLSQNNIIDDLTINIGFYYIFLLVGTFIPFFILKVFMRIKRVNYYNNVNVSIRKLFINSICFFTVVSLSIFISTSLFYNIQIEGNTISSIGLNVDSTYLYNWLFVLTYIIATPMIEEFAFRGILLSTLSKYGKYFAVISSSIIYALAHWSFTEMLPAFVISYILSKITLQYKSIKPAIIMHILFNVSFYLLMLIPDKYTFYVYILLSLIYMISLILVYKGKYIKIKVKKAESFTRTTLIFFTTTSVIIACLLFIFGSILSFISF